MQTRRFIRTPTSMRSWPTRAKLSARRRVRAGCAGASAGCRGWQATPLRFAFEQLLSNALKFTQQRDPAMIEVAASTRNDNEVLVEIRDNGIGFSEQDAHKLFGAFQRLHNDSAYAGGGLGLVTAKRIIECHNGRIWAESQPGIGASF